MEEKALDLVKWGQMTSKSMPRATTSSFIIELPLKTNPHEAKVLLQRLDCARQIMNACTGEALKRLNLMRESMAFRAACKMPGAEARTAAFKAMNEKVGFKDSAIQRYALELRRSWPDEQIDSAATQKLASRAFAPAYWMARAWKSRAGFQNPSTLVVGDFRQRNNF